MVSHQFEPATLTVQVGDTVVWANETEEAHTVTAVESRLPEGSDYFASGNFTSEDEAKKNVGDALIAPDDAYEWTFSEPGTYRYYCIPHLVDGMAGTVVVE